MTLDHTGKFLINSITLKPVFITGDAACCGVIESLCFRPAAGCDGATMPIGTFSTDGTRNFLPPDSNDWVLVIDSAAAHLASPGSADL